MNFFHVNRMIWIGSKIRRTIIYFIFISMMAFFFWFKRPTKLLLQYKYMFKNISFIIGSWMKRKKNFLISFFNDKGFFSCSTTTFTRTIFSRFSFWMKFQSTNFTDFIRKRVTLVISPVFNTAKVSFLDCRRMLMKSFSTIITTNIRASFFSAFFNSFKPFQRSRSPSLPESITFRIAKVIILRLITIKDYFLSAIRTICLYSHNIILNNNPVDVKDIYHFEI